MAGIRAREEGRGKRGRGGKKRDIGGGKEKEGDGDVDCYHNVSHLGDVAAGIGKEKKRKGQKGSKGGGANILGRRGEGRGKNSSGKKRKKGKAAP